MHCVPSARLPGPARSRSDRTTSATALLLGAVLSGCGSYSKDSDFDDKETAPKVNALTEPEANTALMTLQNLGGQSKLDAEADRSSPAPGCLDAFDEITDAPVNAIRDFTADTETGFPLLMSQVHFHDSVEDAKEALDDFRDDMKEYTEVDDTDSD